MEPLVGTLTTGSVITAQEYEFGRINCNETYLPKEHQWEASEEFEINPHQDWFWATVNNKFHLFEIYSTNGQGPFWFSMFRNINLVKLGEQDTSKPFTGETIETKESEIFIIPENETPASRQERFVRHYSTGWRSLPENSRPSPSNSINLSSSIN
jgi:hypothetical protein